MRSGGAQVYESAPVDAAAQRVAAGRRGFDYEALRNRAELADRDVRDGVAGTLEPGRIPGAAGDRRRPLVVPNAECAWRDDRGGHQSDTAQHHRRARPRPAQGVTEAAQEELLGASDRDYAGKIRLATMACRS